MSEEEFDRPSKTGRKKAVQALQDLGEKLVKLSPEQLRKAPLPENLFEAVKDAQCFTRHEARRRQLQYIGKLMRLIDPVPVQAYLDALGGPALSETIRLHRLERLRENLLEDEACLTEIVATWPQVDIQRLRVLRRNALKEREQGKSPKAFREIFRLLRVLEEDNAERHDVSPDEDKEI